MLILSDTIEQNRVSELPDEFRSSVESMCKSDSITPLIISDKPRRLPILILREECAFIMRHMLSEKSLGISLCDSKFYGPAFEKLMSTLKSKGYLVEKAKEQSKDCSNIIHRGRRYELLKVASSNSIIKYCIRTNPRDRILLKTEFDVLKEVNSFFPHLTPKAIALSEKWDSLQIEFVPGECLQDIIHSQPSLESRLRLAKEIISAYIMLAEINVLHRDVSSTNIICTTAGIRLIDFEFASIGNNASRRMPGTTILFMAPEMAYALTNGANDQLYTKRTEAFAVASLIFYLVTGTYLLPLTEEFTKTGYLKKLQLTSFDVKRRVFASTNLINFSEAMEFLLKLNPVERGEISVLLDTEIFKTK